MEETITQYYLYDTFRFNIAKINDILSLEMEDLRTARLYKKILDNEAVQNLTKQINFTTDNMKQLLSDGFLNEAISINNLVLEYLSEFSLGNIKLPMNFKINFEEEQPSSERNDRQFSNIALRLFNVEKLLIERMIPFLESNTGVKTKVSSKKYIHSPTTQNDDDSLDQSLEVTQKKTHKSPRSVATDKIKEIEKKVSQIPLMIEDMRKVTFEKIEREKLQREKTDTELRDTVKKLYEYRKNAQKIEEIRSTLEEAVEKAQRDKLAIYDMEKKLSGFSKRLDEHDKALDGISSGLRSFRANNNNSSKSPPKRLETEPVAKQREKVNNSLEFMLSHVNKDYFSLMNHSKTAQYLGGESGICWVLGDHLIDENERYGFNIRIDSTDYAMICIGLAPEHSSTKIYDCKDCILLSCHNGKIIKDGEYIVKDLSSCKTGDTISLKVDMDIGTVTFFVNRSKEWICTIDKSLRYYPCVAFADKSINDIVSIC